MEYHYVNEQNKKAGPVSVDELKSHGIKADTLVWCQGMGDWKPANQVEELKELFPTVPGSPPPLPRDQADPFAAGNAGFGPGGGYQNSGYQQGGYAGGYPGGQQNYYNIYEPSFDIRNLSPSDIQRFSQHEIRSSFSVGLGIFLHYITFGIFTLIRLGLEFDKLPKIQHDDLGAGKAIGFMFIPFFNLYWNFVFWGQLSKRINFQFKLRGMSPPISNGMPTTYAIIRIIPYVNFLAYLIFMPILFSQIQGACNTLANQNQQGYAGNQGGYTGKSY